MSRILRHWPQISLRAEDVGVEIDFVHIFGREAAVHIEIGTGQGGFLLAQAGTVDYAKAECEKLAEQLAAIARPAPARHNGATKVRISDDEEARDD